MVDTLNRGPYVAAGSMMDNRVETFDGPSIHYQGQGFPNVQFGPIPKDTNTPSATFAWYNGGKVCMVDGIPSAASTSAIAAAQAPSTTQGVALNLVTAVAGTAVNVQVFTPGVSIIPVGGSTPVAVSAIDFGFATGTTTANSSTVAVVDNTQFQVGQWIVIGGAGSVSNKALYTQVSSVSSLNFTTLFISPVAGSSISNAPIGQGNVYASLTPSSPGASIGPAATSASAVEPCIAGGFGKFYDPRQMIARNVVIASVSTTSGTGSFLVTGYDVYGNLMHELIAATASPGGAGQKAFKYVQSIAVQTTATTGTPSNIGVGCGDVYGFHFAVDKAEYLEMWLGGLSVGNASTGFTGAVQANPSTNTTGDVRGTENFATAVAGTAAAGSPAGAKRIVMFYTPPMSDMVAATPINTQPLYGVPQA